MEYRTPSNRWVSDWNIAEKVFEWGRIALEELLPKKNAYDIVMEVSQSASNAILGANQEEAMGILSFINSEI